MNEKPYPLYSKKQVQKAGKRLINRLDEADMPISQAMDIIGNWRVSHHYPINTFQKTLRVKTAACDPNGVVAQRLKRLASIKSKIEETPNMSLSTMQDIGGLRAIVSSMDKLEDLYNEYLSISFEHDRSDVNDYLDGPKSSGYRGVHIIYKYFNRRVPEYNGLNVELQLRTKLQHSWAMAVEYMDVYLGSSLKTGHGPKEWEEYFSLAGSAFSYLERTQPVPGYEQLSRLETFKMLKDQTEKLDVISKLAGYSMVSRIIKLHKRASWYYLIELDITNRRMAYTTFPKSKFSEASNEYVNREIELIDDKSIQVVLVNAGSVLDLTKAYPSYFMDASTFGSYLRKIFHEL